MYGLRVYIKPEDILNKLSEEDRERFNQCVFTDVVKGNDGNVEILCTLFKDEELNQESENRVHYFSTEKIRLI